jgi:hypothetical protein
MVKHVVHQEIRFGMIFSGGCFLGFFLALDFWVVGVVLQTRNNTKMIETLEADIDLAYRTLQFLGELSDEQIPAAVKPKMKDVGTCQ